MALRPGRCFEMSSHFIPSPRRRIIKASSSGDHLDCFFAGGGLVPEGFAAEAGDGGGGPRLVGIEVVTVAEVLRDCGKAPVGVLLAESGGSGVLGSRSIDCESADLRDGGTDAEVEVSDDEGTDAELVWRSTSPP